MHHQRTLDEQWMRHALALAERGPEADPNPRVGCVLVTPSGTVVGEGWHAGSGTPHAEAVALAAAGEAATGCTAYVTLEPCHHHGRTPPCAHALVEARVARVVYAVADPHEVAAGGAQWLASQGVDVDGGVLETPAARVNRTWMHRVRTGRPWVTWKFATTLDGRSAAADGTSRWITGPQARADVHERRSSVGAILVGTGTALADDPQLTARPAGGTASNRQPLRVVMGERDLPPDARLLDDSAPTLQLRTHAPKDALLALHDRDIHHVWIEGGPTVAAAFVREGLIDEVIAYVAPAVLGSGPAAVADLGITSISDIERFTVTDVSVLGPDIRITATPKGEPADVHWNR